MNTIWGPMFHRSRIVRQSFKGADHSHQNQSAESNPTIYYIAILVSDQWNQGKQNNFLVGITTTLQISQTDNQHSQCQFRSLLKRITPDLHAVPKMHFWILKSIELWELVRIANCVKYIFWKTKTEEAGCDWPRCWVTILPFLLGALHHHYHQAWS